MNKINYLAKLSIVVLAFISQVSAEIYQDENGDYQLVSQSGNYVTISKNNAVSFNGRVIVSCPRDYELTKIFDGGVVTCDGSDITVTAGSAVFNFDAEDAQIVDADRIETKRIYEITKRQPAEVNINSRGVVVDDGYDRVEIDNNSGTVSVNKNGSQSVHIGSNDRNLRIESGSGDVVNIESDNLVVSKAKDDLVVDLKNDLLFDFNSAEVKAEAKLLLNQLANLIANQRKGYVAITGHTDSIGDRDYNQELSEKRSGAVAAWLSNNANLSFSDMIIQGLGEDYPVAPNVSERGEDYPDGRALNRRVEIVIQTVKKDPTYLRTPRATLLDVASIARDAALIGAEGARIGADGARIGAEGARIGVEGARIGVEGARIGVAGALTGLEGLAEGLGAASEGLRDARQQIDQEQE